MSHTYTGIPINLVLRDLLRLADNDESNTCDILLNISNISLELIVALTNSYSMHGDIYI